jgi:hypothetical protein
MLKARQVRTWTFARVVEQDLGRDPTAIAATERLDKRALSGARPAEQHDVKAAQMLSATAGARSQPTRLALHDHAGRLEGLTVLINQLRLRDPFELRIPGSQSSAQLVQLALGLFAGRSDAARTARSNRSSFGR